MPVDNQNRRFTLLELLTYVSLFGVVLGSLLSLGMLAERVGPTFEPLVVIVAHIALAMLGALIGLAISFAGFGRRRAAVGAVFGGVVLPLLFNIAFAIAVYRTHR